MTTTMNRKEFLKITDAVKAGKTLKEKYEAEKQDGANAYLRCLAWRTAWVKKHEIEMKTLKALEIKKPAPPQQQHGGALDEDDDVEMMEIDPVNVENDDGDTMTDMKEMFRLLEEEVVACNKRMKKLKDMMKVVKGVMDKL